MTQDELTARQLHNINQAVFGIALAVRTVLLAANPTLEQPLTASDAAATTLAEFDSTMQAFADRLTQFTALVAQQNRGSGIILPN